MDILDDFFELNPGASYEDYMNMHNAIHQDLMSPAMPNIDLDIINDMQPMPFVDSFGIPHYANPLHVDFMSGIPSDSFTPVIPEDNSFGGNDISIEQAKLETGRLLEDERDVAVQHYQDAKHADDIDEMLKWEAIANQKQQQICDLWSVSTYGLPAKAPGID